MTQWEPGSTVEISNVAPILRDDLKFRLQQHGGQTCFLIEDEMNARFHRVGIPEYTFLSLLDGKTTLGQAVAQTVGVLGKDALDEAAAANLCKWLIDSQLAETESSRTTGRLLAVSEKAFRRKQAQWLNPVMVRLPLVRPDRWLGWLHARFGVCLGWGGLVVWITALLIALHQFANHWGTLSWKESLLWAPGNLVSFTVALCGLKLLHELAHAMACKRFGGQVREAGILLIALAPIPYVDVTSSWRFQSRWQRIFVAAAGMLVELFVAALASIVWIHTPQGFLHQLAGNIMISASVVTLLFNANPLMRFDGYYILSDLVDIPNLYGLGQQYIRYLGQRYFCGMRVRLPTWSKSRSWIIRSYGVATLLWRVLVTASLLLFTANIFHGAGIVLALPGLALWVAVPLGKTVRYLMYGNPRERPNRLRVAMMTVLSALVIAGVLNCPQPGGVRAPAVVQYEPMHIVRAPFQGFVREVRARSGMPVEKDQVLVVIASSELELEIRQLTGERVQSELRSRQFQDAGDVGAARVEQEMRAAIDSRLDKRLQQLANAQVKAPVTGHVISRDLDSLLGAFVEEGQTLLELGDESRKELKVSVAQHDLHVVGQYKGEPVDVLVPSARTVRFHAQWGVVDPHASHQLSDPALAAANGGPLAVRPVNPTGNPRDGQDTLELVEPRLVANVPLNSEQSQSVHAGQTAIVRLHVARGSIGKLLYRRIADWFDTRWRAGENG